MLYSSNQKQYVFSKEKTFDGLPEPKNPKPDFQLEDVSNYKLVEKAASKLACSGNKEAAKAIHKVASKNGYELWVILKLLKIYMNI